MSALSSRIFTLLIVTLAALNLAVPAMAGDISPVGSWQSLGGESRYEVVRCGGGTQLCARLTWLRSDARTAENLPYLNHYVVSGAMPVSDNRWRGTVHYDGENMSGNLTMLDDNRLRVSGCRLIMCQTLEFERI